MRPPIWPPSLATAAAVAWIGAVLDGLVLALLPWPQPAGGILFCAGTGLVGLGWSLLLLGQPVVRR